MLVWVGWLACRYPEGQISPRRGYYLEEARRLRRDVKAPIQTNSKMMREDWRKIGEALLIGRKLHKSDKHFGQWCKEKGFGDMDRRDRADAMWLAENWATVDSVDSNHCHPTHIRQTYRDSQSGSAVALVIDGQIPSMPRGRLDGWLSGETGRCRMIGQRLTHAVCVGMRKVWLRASRSHGR